MKCRQDFVTNSSSSSFIFGLPSGNDYSTEILFRQIKIWTMELLNLMKVVDGTLKLNNPDKYKMVSRLRKLNKDRWKKDGFNIRLQNEFEYLNKNLEGFEFTRCLMAILENNNFYLDYKKFFEFYVNSCSRIDNLKKFITYNSYNQYYNDIDKPFKFSIIDFKNIKEKDFLDVDEIVNWYCNVDADVFLSEEEINSMSYKYVGEICVFSECGYIPDILVEMLKVMSVKSEEHMG